jgi:hypothetical protein
MPPTQQEPALVQAAVQKSAPHPALSKAVRYRVCAATLMAAFGQQAGYSTTATQSESVLHDWSYFEARIAEQVAALSVQP